jgi:hypothetical protein
VIAVDGDGGGGGVPNDVLLPENLHSPQISALSVADNSTEVTTPLASRVSVAINGLSAVLLDRQPTPPCVYLNSKPMILRATLDMFGSVPAKELY